MPDERDRPAPRLRRGRRGRGARGRPSAVRAAPVGRAGGAGRSRPCSLIVAGVVGGHRAPRRRRRARPSRSGCRRPRRRRGRPLGRAAAAPDRRPHRPRDGRHRRRAHRLGRPQRSTSRSPTAPPGRSPSSAGGSSRRPRCPPARMRLRSGPAGRCSSSAVRERSESRRWRAYDPVRRLAGGSCSPVDVRRRCLVRVDGVDRDPRSSVFGVRGRANEFLLLGRLSSSSIAGESLPPMPIGGIGVTKKAVWTGEQVLVLSLAPGPARCSSVPRRVGSDTGPHRLRARRSTAPTSTPTRSSGRTTRLVLAVHYDTPGNLESGAAFDPVTGDVAPLPASLSALGYPRRSWGW